MERKPYATDLTDEQWEMLEPLLPEAKPGGRPRTTDLREAMNTLLYQNRTGCQYDMLPHDLLAQEHGLRVLRGLARQRGLATGVGHPSRRVAIRRGPQRRA